MRVFTMVFGVMMTLTITIANAQNAYYDVAPGCAVSGSDSYGNSYSGNIAPGGAMEMTNQYGQTYSGAVDPFGNANLSR